MSKSGVISGPYFPAFGLNTERYEASLCIQSECGKIRTRNNSVSGHFPRSVKACKFIKKETVIMDNKLISPYFDPSGHQTSFGRLMDVFMKSGGRLMFYWTSKGRLMPAGIQVLSCEFCKTFFLNNFFYRTSPLAAS